jgi:hypothetical protein
MADYKIIQAGTLFVFEVDGKSVGVSPSINRYEVNGRVKEYLIQNKITDGTVETHLGNGGIEKIAISIWVS